MNFKDKKKILFVAHSPSKTGAPIVFFNLVSWLMLNTNKEIVILFKYSGDLITEFDKIGKTFIWHHPKNKYFHFRILNKILKNIFKTKFDYNQYKILNFLKKEKFDLIYLNSVTSHDLVKIIKSTVKSPVLSHIHEMEYSLNTYFSNLVKNALINEIDQFITVSNLCDSQFKNVIQKKIETKIVNPFVNLALMQKPTIDTELLAKEINVQNKFVVGGCGYGGFVKGLDLFIELSRKVIYSFPDLPIQFLWIGDVKNEIICEYSYDNKMLGYPENIIFCGIQKYPQNYFNLFDVFTLTSRADSFPLVAIEAASLGKPIICFKGASGIPEMIEKEGGFVVPYLDVNEMMEKVILLFNNPNLQKTNSSAIKQISLDYDVSKKAPIINNIIDDMINKKL